MCRPCEAARSRGAVMWILHLTGIEVIDLDAR